MKNPRVIFGIVLFLLLAVAILYFVFRPKTPDYYLFDKTNEETVGGSINARVFFIALEDNGKIGKKIGCNDSVVPVWVTASSSAPLRSVLEILLSQKDHFVSDGALMNSLYASDLKIKSLSIENSIAKIYLTGQYSLSGVCDDPRFKAQIEETALQFETVKKVEIYINDAPIDLLFSQKGE